MTLAHDYDLFVRAANDAVDLVDQIDGQAWSSPGLGEWDLRALVGHTSRSFITVTQYLDQLVDVQEIGSVEAYYMAVAEITGTDSAAVAERGRQAGDALGSDPKARFAELAAAAVERLRAQPDVLMHSAVGGIWLRDYLPTRIFELAVHGLDIATAIGTEPRLDPAVVAAAVDLAARTAVAQGHGVELLLALTGRGVLGSDFSVV